MRPQDDRPQRYRPLLALIDRLYAAALDPSAWNDFLVLAADVFGADHAFVSQIDRRHGVLDYIGLPLPKRDVLPVSRYARLLGDDPRRTVFDASPGRAIHCGMGLSRPRLCASRTYREYLEPLGIEYTMVAAPPVRENVSHDFGLTQNAKGRSFLSEDCELMNELVPHLHRALEVARAVEGSRERREIPPAAAATPPAEDWQRDRLRLTFALSPAQVRLAMLLFRGDRIKQAAGQLGITEGSARQYLKAIFVKTGAKRQADLVRVIREALRT